MEIKNIVKYCYYNAISLVLCVDKVGSIFCHEMFWIFVQRPHYDNVLLLVVLYHCTVCTVILNITTATSTYKATFVLDYLLCFHQHKIAH